MAKLRVGFERDNWLRVPENFERWIKPPKQGGLAQSEKRVLVSDSV